MAIHDIAKHIRLMIRRIANPIVIPIIPGVIAPIIATPIFREEVWTLTTLGGLKRRLPYLFGISNEIISHKNVLLRTIAEVQADVIGGDQIAFEPILGRLLNKDASILTGYDIVSDLGIIQLLEEQSVTAIVGHRIAVDH